MAMQQELKGKVEDQTPKEKVKSLRIRVVDNTKEGRPALGGALWRQQLRIRKQRLVQRAGS